jgi:hypothetical protein
VPAQLAPHLVGALPKAAASGAPTARAATATAISTAASPAAAIAELVVFASSAAWCTRLRYALVGLQEEVDARAGAPVRISVRVLMRSEVSGG